MILISAPSFYRPQKRRYWNTSIGLMASSWSFQSQITGAYMKLPGYRQLSHRRKTKRKRPSSFLAIRRTWKNIEGFPELKPVNSWTILGSLFSELRLRTITTVYERRLTKRLDWSTSGNFQWNEDGRAVVRVVLWIRYAMPLIDLAEPHLMRKYHAERVLQVQRISFA